MGVCSDDQLIKIEIRKKPIYFCISQTDIGNVATQEPSSTFSGVQNVRNQGSEPQVVDSVNTIFGSIPLKSSNPLTPELRSTLLPVMKALLKVMETDRPAPEDINSLLLLTRGQYMSYYPNLILDLLRFYSKIK